MDEYAGLLTLRLEREQVEADIALFEQEKAAIKAVRVHGQSNNE
jgi:hypothetical protein